MQYQTRLTETEDNIQEAYVSQIGSCMVRLYEQFKNNYNNKELEKFRKLGIDLLTEARTLIEGVK